MKVYVCVGQGAPPSSQPGVRMKEVEQLRATNEQLEMDLEEAKANLAAKEASGKKLGQHCHMHRSFGFCCTIRVHV